MDVDGALAQARAYGWRKNLHVAGKHNQVAAFVVDDLQQLLFLAVLSLRIDGQVRASVR